MINNYFDDKSNKGFTLVELIIAISLGTVISLAIGSLIAFAVSNFNNQSRNTQLQYETQTTLNQVVDSIESASWFHIKNEEVDGKTKTLVAAFGKIEYDPDASKWFFKGEVFETGDADGEVTNSFNVYMNRYKDSSGIEIAGADINARMADAATKIESLDIKNDKYLLGKDATLFEVQLDSGNFRTVKINGVDTNIYDNPILFNAKVEFSKYGYGSESDGTTRIIRKQIEDKAYSRNRMNKEMTIQYGGKTYKQQ